VDASNDELYISTAFLAFLLAFVWIGMETTISPAPRPAITQFGFPFLEAAIPRFHPTNALPAPPIIPPNRRFLCAFSSKQRLCNLAP